MNVHFFNPKPLRSVGSVGTFSQIYPCFFGKSSQKKKEKMGTWFIESFNLLRDMFSTLILDGGSFVLRIALHTLMNS